MTKISTLAQLRPIHPFPARMAPAIVWNRLQRERPGLRVLDPMAGSGTTLVTAKALGHTAIGFDTDPLAVLIARAWCSEVNEARVMERAQEVVLRAHTIYRDLPLAQAYPHGADEETRAFVRFWFDGTSRRQLAALSTAIRELRSPSTRPMLWCALSRLIITKTAGASLAMDVSHSRPHRVYTSAPIKPLAGFSQAVARALKGALFRTNASLLPTARVKSGDARALPLENSSVDVVITSPPYANAIDYLRGHRLSLVWLGHALSDIRAIRATNVGAEVAHRGRHLSPETADVLKRMGGVERLPPRQRGFLARYVDDMREVTSEIKRVLTRGGRAVLVMGDSTLRGVFIRNSEAVKYLARQSGLLLRSVRRRAIEDKRRYLPPPATASAGSQLQTRMREEVILAFDKPE